jgi:adenine deaminase
MFIYNKDNRELVETALGNRPADLVIRDGVLMDVYSGRLLSGRSIAVSGKWIACLGENVDQAIGENTRIIDAGGRVLAPGYIDSHTHIANYCDLSDILECMIPGGTTSVITEVETYSISLGVRGFKMFLDQVRNRPVNIFCLIPPMVSLSPAMDSRYITADQARELLKEEIVAGLGESYWQNVILTPDDRVLELMRETVRAGKAVQGHSAGASGRKLAAYAAAGAQSCHESVSAEDVLARLEMGFYNIIREGHIRHDLESIRPLIGRIDLRRCTLCTDGADPEGLLNRGYLVDVVQKAVDMGIELMDAVRMVTLNPAEHFGLSHLIGGLAPGRFADILILPEPGVMQPDIVISGGRETAKDGKTLVDLERIPFPDELLNTVHVPSVKPEDFRVSRASVKTDVVRTIDIQSNGLVAKEGNMKIPGTSGDIVPDTGNDILKVVFIESVSGKGEKFTGFIRGWGQRNGAIASSLTWDSAGIIAIGANDKDIALAVNRIIEMQGGIALSVNGELKHSICYSIGAYSSLTPIRELNNDVTSLLDSLRDLGVRYDNPVLTLVTLTTGAIPFIRLSEKGYFRFRENDYVGL